MLEQLLNGDDYNVSTIMLFGVIAILTLMISIAIGFGLSALITDKDIFLGIMTLVVTPKRSKPYNTSCSTMNSTYQAFRNELPLSQLSKKMLTTQSISNGYSTSTLSKEKIRKNSCKNSSLTFSTITKTLKPKRMQNVQR